MIYKRRRRFAFALVICLLFGLLPGTSRAEQTQAEPVADTPAAETPETSVPAARMPTDTLDAIEAEQVSLSQNEVRVIKGETKSLIPETPADKSGQTAASPLAAAGVVWTSSNPAVATVNSSGIVTGVDLGRAVITANLNNAVIETFTAIVTLENGFYVFETLSSAYFICPTAISMKNGTALYAMESESSSLETLTTRGEIGRKWYVQYHYEDYEDYYSIRPAFSHDMVLHQEDENSMPTLWKRDSVASVGYLWKIVSGTYYYVLQNKATSKSLAFAAEDSSGSQLEAVNYSATDSSQNWCILDTLTPSGMLLFDYPTGDLLDYDLRGYPTSLEVHDRGGYAGRGLSFTLDELGIYVQSLNHTSPSVSVTFSNNKASFNSSTKKITGNQLGSTNATISASTAGTTYSVGLSVDVVEPVSIAVQYDHAYSARYSNYLSRINQHTQELTTKYSREFHIFLNTGTPTLFTSYGDMCTNSSYSLNCQCSSDCSNAETDFEPENHSPQKYHHKNAYNILHGSANDISTRTLDFIGHNICQIKGSNHVYGELGGLALLPDHLYPDFPGLAQVYNHQSLVGATRSTVHEVGHLFKILDHYGFKGVFTDTLNNYYQDVLHKPEFNEFSENCIYGENKANSLVTANLVICEGCRKIATGELTYPYRPPEEGE